MQDINASSLPGSPEGSLIAKAQVVVSPQRWVFVIKKPEYSPVPELNMPKLLPFGACQFALATPVVGG